MFLLFVWVGATRASEDLQRREVGCDLCPPVLVLDVAAAAGNPFPVFLQHPRSKDIVEITCPSEKGSVFFVAAREAMSYRCQGDALRLEGLYIWDSVLVAGPSRDGLVSLPVIGKPCGASATATW